MRVDILSAVPQLLESPFSHSIMKRAVEKGIAEIYVHDIRDYSTSKHKQIDDYQFGGGAGMVMMIEPIMRCIEELSSQREYDEIIFMTPDGELLNQKMVNQLSLNKNLILICGHYKGIDERLREHVVTKEISIGDYVLSGGELPAAVLVDAVVRLIPGVLNDETSALSDSFQDDILSAPVYTRPANYNGWEVPEVLLSGHAAKIENWRHEKAIERTQQRRPDLLTNKQN
ncbi:MAG TPA: tRNA (guanosine(37)-N1)-methyltransferase TrmD [Chitinophagales bacterium]|nr:tRNA (guanosine(37)-N1)-methyltransferase TrmD [Chitinophagales bacterium]